MTRNTSGSPGFITALAHLPSLPGLPAEAQAGNLSITARYPVEILAWFVVFRHLAENPPRVIS